MSSSSDYTPIEDMLESTFEWYGADPERLIREEISPDPSERAKSRFVYIVHCPPSYYKIGIAASVKNRVASIDTCCPFEVTLLHSFEADNALEAEQKLHILFEPFHHKGEWFILGAKELSYLKHITRYCGGYFYRYKKL